MRYSFLQIGTVTPRACGRPDVRCQGEDNMAQSLAETTEIRTRNRPTAQVWFEPRRRGGLRPSWIVRGHCIITDTSALKQSGQVFVAGRNCVPIDVSFIDANGTGHWIDGAGVVEFRFDDRDGREVHVFVYEPPTQATE